MRVLQVTSTDDRRGAETFARQLGDALRASGSEVTTVALAPSGATHPQPFRVLGPGRSHPRTLMALVGAARAHDVLVAHGGTTLQPVVIAGVLTGRPVVYRNIGDPSHWGRARGAHLRVGVPLRRAAAVMALYPGAGRYLEERYRLLPDRVVLTANAVDGRAFRRRTDPERRVARAALGVEEGPPLVGYLGSLSPEKDPLAAVAAVDGIPGAQLLVAGAGPLEAEVEAQARRRQGTVRRLGQVADPAAFLTALDALVLPSRTEGVPGTLLEAAVVGVPVVATDVGGVRDVLEPLGGGLVVDAGDTPALTTALTAVLTDPGHHVSPVEEVLARHDLPVVAREWQQVLEKVTR